MIEKADYLAKHVIGCIEQGKVKLIENLVDHLEAL